MSNVTLVVSGFVVSSLLIFPGIFVEFSFSVENELGIKSLSRKMLAVRSTWLLLCALKDAEEERASVGPEDSDTVLGTVVVPVPVHF